VTPQNCSAFKRKSLLHTAISMKTALKTMFVQTKTVYKKKSMLGAQVPLMYPIVRKCKFVRRMDQLINVWNTTQNALPIQTARSKNYVVMGFARILISVTQHQNVLKTIHAKVAYVCKQIAQ